MKSSPRRLLSLYLLLNLIHNEKINIYRVPIYLNIPSLSLVVLLVRFRLFLQSPANPDLLFIIFFCHTQLTVTLLLALIFGSKVRK